MLVEYEFKRKDKLLIVLKLCLSGLALYMLQYYMPLLMQEMTDSREQYEEPMIRVIANSNTGADQQLKQKVVADLQDIHYINIENTRIIQQIEQRLTESYATLPLEVKAGENLLPPAMYQGVFYPQTTAKSIAIVIGAGRGNNWFCTVFPKVCGKDEEEKVRFTWWEWLKEKWA